MDALKAKRNVIFKTKLTFSIIKKLCLKHNIVLSDLLKTKKFKSFSKKILMNSLVFDNGDGNFKEIDEFNMNLIKFLFLTIPEKNYSNLKFDDMDFLFIKVFNDNFALNLKLLEELINFKKSKGSLTTSSLYLERNRIEFLLYSLKEHTSLLKDYNVFKTEHFKEIIFNISQDKWNDVLEYMIRTNDLYFLSSLPLPKDVDSDSNNFMEKLLPKKILKTFLFRDMTKYKKKIFLDEIVKRLGRELLPLIESGSFLGTMCYCTYIYQAIPVVPTVIF